MEVDGDLLPRWATASPAGVVDADECYRRRRPHDAATPHQPVTDTVCRARPRRGTPVDHPPTGITARGDRQGLGDAGDSKEGAFWTAHLKVAASELGVSPAHHTGWRRQAASGGKSCELFDAGPLTSGVLAGMTRSGSSRSPQRSQHPDLCATVQRRVNDSFSGLERVSSDRPPQMRSRWAAPRRGSTLARVASASISGLQRLDPFRTTSTSAPARIASEQVVNVSVGQGHPEIV